MGAALLGMALPAGGAGAGKGFPEHPDILLIMADDMGYSDLGCYGSEIATPHLDQLAARGIRFSQFYNAARCCPSRACLLTGLYPHQAGIGDMMKDLGVPSYQGYLNDRCLTLGEALRAAGYRTLMSGKWHVGNRGGGLPTDRGFDRYFGLIDGASSYFERIPYRINQEAPRMMAGNADFEPPEQGFYMTDAITDHALGFLEEHNSREEPFFLYLAYTAPHWPLHALPDDIARYRGRYLKGWDSLREERFRRQKELGLLPRDLQLSPRDPNVPAWDTLEPEEKEQWDLRMAVYAAMVDRLDRNIGRILEQIEKMGRTDHTLVLFLADNGGCHERIRNRGNYIRKPGETGSRNSFDAYEFPWANVSNTPFRMHKHWVHEGGISTPCIVRLPGNPRDGAIIMEPGHIIDIMPTLLDFAGGSYPEEYRGQPLTQPGGISLKPILEGRGMTRKEPLFWEHEGNRAMRDGKWKLVSQYDEKEKKFMPWELYNLERDRSELRDLSASHTRRREKMAVRYEAWAARAGVVSRELLDRQ